MVTAAHIVERIISERPFLEDGLARGIINYAALAEEISPEVESSLGKKTSHAAVMMAVRRHADRARKTLVADVRFGRDVELVVRSELVEITVRRSAAAGEMLRKLDRLVDVDGGDFLSVITGLREMSIITSTKHKDSVLSLVGRNRRKVISDLSAIMVRIPEDAAGMVGLFYLLTRQLAWRNISIVEIVSTWSETGFVVKTIDVPAAFSCLRDTVESRKEKK